MATEISVIVDGKPTIDASPEERALAFEKMASANRTWSRSTIDAFAEMYDTPRADDAPTITELLLRRIIEDGARSTIDSSLIVPIITASKRRWTGGALPRIMRKAQAQVESSPDAIRVRFDSTVRCLWAVLDDGKIARSREYVASAGEEIEVVGLLIRARTDDPTITVRGVASTVEQALRSGHYLYSDLGGVLPLLEQGSAERVLLTTQDDFVPTMRAQFARLQIALDAHAVHNAITAAITVRDTSVPRVVVDALTVAPGIPIPDITRVLDQPIARMAPPQALLDVFEAVHWGRFTLRTVDSVYADMLLRGFARLYHRAVLAGRDDKVVREGLSVFTLSRERALKAAEDARKRDDERNDLEIYRTLIGRKISAARLREVDRGLRQHPVLRVKSGGILTLLPAAERKTIELEYRLRKKYLDESVNNTCPHVKLARALRRAVDDAARKSALDALSEFLPSGSHADSMITCKRCKHDVICPHSLAYIKLDLAMKPQNEIKAALNKYATGRHQGANGASIDCKICGEVLSNLEEFETSEVRIASSNMDEELRNMIWGEIAGLVRHLKFATVTDVRALISSAREVIYPHIFDFEKQIIKSKTSSADERTSKLRLYVAIYGMAYLIRIIESSKNVSFRDAKPGMTVAESVKFGLDLLMLTRNVIIREIPGMSLDVVKNALVAAYKSLGKAQLVEQSTPVGGLLMTLMIDPIYNYYYTMDLIASKRGRPRKHDREDQVSRIMGADISKLERRSAQPDPARSIFANVIMPHLPPAEPFMKLTEFRAGRKLDLRDIMRAYASASFAWFDAKQRDRAFDQHQYVATSADLLTVKFRPVHQTHSDAAARIAASESVLDQYRALAGVQAYGPVSKTPGPSRRWSNPVVPLSRVFDETGASHKWTEYLIRPSPDEPVETRTSQQLADAAAAGSPFVGEVIDRKCGRCGQLESAVGALSETKIRAALRSRNKRGNFFRYYENRCPEGGLHERQVSASGVAPCSKCGLAVGTEPADYFSKYASKYAASRKNADVIAPPAKPLADTSRFASEYAKWSYDFNIVIDLAGKLDVNHRLLSALGATGGVNYADIISGAFIPGEYDDKQSTRATLVNSHVQTLLTEYNMLRYYANILKPPYDLAAVVDSSNYPRHLFAGLATALPDVYDDYNDRYLHVSIHKRPREIVDFCIQSFCQKCLRIWGEVIGENTPLSRLRQDFVRYVVKKILRGEELMTKPGHFNWSLLYGDSKEKTYDSNTERDDDAPADAPEDTDDDPLTTDAFDVEGDDDEDDPSNGVRVGEDLGM